MLNKVIKPILVVIAVSIALIYTFGYGYIFNGIKLTYLKGKTGSSIDDGNDFPSKVIEKGIAKPWEKDPNYNKIPLTIELKSQLENSKSIAYLVIKDGKLKHEQYWDNYNASSQSNSFSMAKAVTVMLLGTALQDGNIKYLDQKISDFYDSYKDSQFGKELTLKELAAMESGMDWEEDYQNPFLPNARAYYGNNLAEATFSRSIIEKPGEKFNYQSGSTQLLGFAIRKAVNIPIAYYASAKLWKPLGMEQNAAWTVDDNGMEKTYCCIHSNARDFAKLGKLLLDNGKVDSLQVLNPSFVQKMITPTKASNGIYGLGVWINNKNENPYYYLRGLYGQYVIVIPKENMIIVRLGFETGKDNVTTGHPKELDLYTNQSVKLFR